SLSVPRVRAGASIRDRDQRRAARRRDRGEQAVGTVRGGEGEDRGASAMTTVAVRDGVMACDSRMTGEFIAQAHKVIQGEGILVGYCGDCIAAYAFAEYVAGLSEDKPHNGGDDDIELLVLKGRKLFLVDNRLRWFPIPERYYAIGSGSQAAMVAMHMGATAREAVEMAKRVDPYTGGRVREFTL